MPRKTARLCIAPLLFTIAFSACGPTQDQQAVVATAPPASAATASLPPAMNPPTASLAPTALPSPALAPPTPTPDPWATYAPYTIEGLRAREYGEGEIEIVDTMEQAANFT